MSETLNEDLVEKIDQLPRHSLSGSYYRYTSARRDPLSGGGARANGGRWNPRGIFPAIYLASPREACAGEVGRAAAALGTTPQVMFQASYLLHTVSVRDVLVLDLSESKQLEQVGLSMNDVTDDDWAGCQAVGHAAWFLGFQGVLAPSASGRGQVLAAFEGRVDVSQLRITDSDPLTATLYARLS